MNRAALGLAAVVAGLALTVLTLRPGRERAAVEAVQAPSSSETSVPAPSLLSLPEPEPERTEPAAPASAPTPTAAPDIAVAPIVDRSDSPRSNGGRTVPFVVRDTTGEPILGAIGHAGRYSRATDAEGRSLVEGVDPEVTKLRVMAADHALAAVEIPEILDSPLEVVLEAATRLEVEVRSIAGTRATDNYLLIEAERGLFPGDLYLPSGLMTRFGASLAMTTISRGADGPCTVTFPLDGTVVVLPDIQPQRLSLRVCDSLDFPLHEEPEFDLARGETKRVSITLATAPRPLEGQVLDPQWRPVARAKVSLKLREGGSGIYQQTNAEGFFTFRSIAATEAFFIVEKDGYASIQTPRSALPADGQLDPFLVPPERCVQVRIQDPDGRLLAAERVTATAPGWGIPQAVRLASGAYMLCGLPPEEARLRITIGGNEHELACGSDRTEAVVEVPAHGSLIVELRDPGPMVDDTLWVIVRARDGQKVVALEADPDDPRAPLVFPALLPGTYMAELGRKVGQEEEWTCDAPPVEVRVSANQETRIDLSR